MKRLAAILLIAASTVRGADYSFPIYLGLLESDMDAGGYSITNLNASFYGFTNWIMPSITASTNGIYGVLAAEDVLLWNAINSINSTNTNSVSADFVTNSANYRIGVSNVQIRAEIAERASTNAPTIFNGNFVGSNWLATAWAERFTASAYFQGVLKSGTGAVWIDADTNTIASFTNSTLTFAVPLAGDGPGLFAGKVKAGDNDVWLSTRAADAPLAVYAWDLTTSRVVFGVEVAAPLFTGSGAGLTNTVSQSLTNNLSWIDVAGKAMFNDGEISLGVLGDGVVKGSEFRGLLSGTNLMSGSVSTGAVDSVAYAAFTSQVGAGVDSFNGRSGAVTLTAGDVTNALPGTITNNTTGNAATAGTAAVAVYANYVSATSGLLLQYFYGSLDLLTLEADGMHALTNLFGTKFSATDGFYGPVKPADNAAWLKTAAADFTLARYLWDGVDQRISFDVPIIATVYGSASGLSNIVASALTNNLSWISSGGLALFNEGQVTVGIAGDGVVVATEFRGSLSGTNLMAGSVSTNKVDSTAYEAFTRDTGSTATVTAEDSSITVTPVQVSPGVTNFQVRANVTGTSSVAYDGQTVGVQTNTVFSIALTDGQQMIFNVAITGVKNDDTLVHYWSERATVKRTGSSISRHQIPDGYIYSGGNTELILESGSVKFKVIGDVGDTVDWRGIITYHAP